MTAFSLSAPMAIDHDVMPTSFLEHMSSALGRMSGGMISDGVRLDIGNDSLGLMCLQALFVEAESDLLILGACRSTPGDCAFVAMSDGAIWRVELMVEGGKLNVNACVAESDDVTENCACLPFYHSMIKSAVAQSLHSSDLVQKGDTVSGHINTDAHAAICMRAKGHGKFIVNVGETQAVRGGFDWVVDCARPNATFNEVAASVSSKPLTMEEIQQEREDNNSAFGVDSPFPTKMGEA